MKSTQRKRTRADLRFVRGPIDGVTEYNLGNGLKVLLKPDRSAPVVTTLVVYRVGSRNEGPGTTGSAHFLEHLLFKGSNNFNAQIGNNIDDLFKKVGIDWNAFTTNDQTVYHEQASSEHLELCVAIEADRMRWLRMRKEDRDSEMTVVRNEMEQGENHPQEALSKQMWATAFREHPYHHDTIGSRTEVENVPLANLRSFYQTYYWPNNATLILVGDFEEADALTVVRKHFGKIPASQHKIPQVYTVEPPQEGERRFQIRRAGDLYRLTLGFHIPQTTHPDMAPLQALAQLLGNSYSRSSRLYKRLVEGGLASHVFAHARALRDPGLFLIDVDLTEKTKPARAEAATLNEIRKMQTRLISQDELARIKVANRKDTKLRLAESKHYGFQLAEAEAVAGDWRWLKRSDDEFDAVTAEDIRRVAIKYLTKDNRTVGVFIPKTEQELGSEQQESSTENPAAAQVKPKKESTSPKDPKALQNTLDKLTGTPPTRTPIAQRIVSQTLANGLTINVLREKIGSGVLSVGMSIKAGNYFEGKTKQNLADIVGSMLPLGSKGVSKEELSDKLMEMGLRYGMHFSVGPFIAQTGAELVVEDLPNFLQLLQKVICRPLFKAAELTTIKGTWLSEYQEHATHPSSVATNTLGNSIFQPTDTFYQKTLSEQITDLQSMTVQDVVQFHRQFYTPSSAIFTLVGDIDPTEVIRQIQAAFGTWTGQKASEIVVPAPALPQSRDIVRRLPDKPGITILLGRPIDLKKSDPDAIAASVALMILGGDTITARLGKKLREEGGLTYGIQTGLWDNSYGGAPWFINLSVNADNVAPALKMTREILLDFFQHGITEEELKTEVSSVIGHYNLRLTTMGELARAIAKSAALNFGFDRLDTYTACLRALTREEVNAAIKKHFDPANLVTVIAGDV